MESNLSAWDVIASKRANARQLAKKLHLGEQSVRIEGLEISRSKTGNRCVRFNLVNRHGEHHPMAFSLEPQHLGYLRQFIGKFTGRDPEDFLPNGIEALEGIEFEVFVVEDEYDRWQLQPSA